MNGTPKLIHLDISYKTRQPTTLDLLFDSLIRSDKVVRSLALPPPPQQTFQSRLEHICWPAEDI